MSRTTTILACVGLSLPVAVFVACSASSSGGNVPTTCDQGGGDGGSCTPGTTPAYTTCLTTSELQTPGVSFKSDIQPIFNQSCAIGGAECHGAPNNPSLLQIYLGVYGDAGTPDAAEILSGLVGKPAGEDSQIDLITAGDPGASYLMHKMDDDQCQFASDCPDMTVEMGQKCGVGMPFSSGILGVTTRDQVRKWIAQGAKNN